MIDQATNITDDRLQAGVERKATTPPTNPQFNPLITLFSLSDNLDRSNQYTAHTNY